MVLSHLIYEVKNLQAQECGCAQVAIRIKRRWWHYDNMRWHYDMRRRHCNNMRRWRKIVSSQMGEVGKENGGGRQKHNLVGQMHSRKNIKFVRFYKLD